MNMKGVKRVHHPPYYEEFCQQQGNAARRGIGFHLTFEEWMTIWTESGHLAERGRGKNLYVMSRIGDKGNYEVGNVFIQLNCVNAGDYWVGKTHETTTLQTMSEKRVAWWAADEERAAKARQNMRQPKPKFWCAVCERFIGGASNMKRWHSHGM